MRRGDVWIRCRIGHEYKVVVVKTDSLTEKVGALGPASVELVDMSFRVALAL